MASWECREAENLVAAIAKHRRDSAETQALDESLDADAVQKVDVLLQAVQSAADNAADSDATSAEDLMQIRANLCGVCRESKLYDCDVAKGWSEHCTFVFANTTEFGSL